MLIAGSRFTVDDIISGKYKVELFNGTWLQDNQLLMTDANNNLQILDSASSVFQPLVINESLVSLRFHRGRSSGISTSVLVSLLHSFIEDGAARSQIHSVVR